MTSVSVIMASFYTGPVLWLSIESVLAQEGLEELVIVDNGNPRPVVRRLKNMAEQDPRLILITGQRNVGFAAACNQGAQKATGEYLLVLNPDCILPRDTFARGVAALAETDNAWVAGCCLIGPDGQAQPGARRHLLTPWRAMVEGLKLYRLAPRHPYFAGMNIPTDDAAGIQKVPATSGAFMLMRRERYIELEGMDDAYFLHVEDLDFCFKVKQAGGDIIYVPDLKVMHFLSTSRASAWFLEWNKARGFTRYFYKHYRKTYPPGFLELVAAGIWVRFLFKVLVMAPFCALRRAGLSPQENLQHLRRLVLLRDWEDAREIRPEGLAPGEAVVVTGATGQVGVATVRMLLKAGLRVIAVRHRTSILFEHPRLVWVRANLDTDVLDLGNETPKAIVHTASIWMLPKHMKQLKQAGITRVIAFGSTSLFGKASSRNTHEIDLVKRFGRAEEELRQQAREHDMHLTILRPTLIYGVGLDRNVSRIRAFAERFRFFPVYPPASGKRQPVHVFDLARAAASILGNPVTYGQAYDLSGQEVVTYRAMVERIFTVLERPPRVIGVPFLPRLMDVFSRLLRRSDTNGEVARRMNEDLDFSFEKAAQDFGYAPRGFLSRGRKDLGDYLE